MPCIFHSVSSSILAAKSPKSIPLVLATSKEGRQARQGDIVTFGELAEFLQLHSSMQLHPSAVYRLLRRGALPAFKVGPHWRFSREAIDRLVQLETRQ
jgi:excisionase family DNA binding protein